MDNVQAVRLSVNYSTLPAHVIPNMQPQLGNIGGKMQLIHLHVWYEGNIG